MAPAHLSSSRPPVPAPLEERVPDGMRSYSFHAMGTTITVMLPESRFDEAAPLVEHLFARWEQTLTRFHADSELSHLNQHAGAFTVVSPLLFDVLSTAVAAAAATDGVYDPTLLTQLKQAGYDRSFELLPATQASAPTHAHPGGAWRDITLDAATSCVYLPPEAQIDLGGIAKGMAVDAALEALRERGITSALVNAGGDLVVIGLSPELDHWPVAIPAGATIQLYRGAMATSGQTHRQWRQGKQIRHHLIDPRTGTSALSPIQTATVVADRCVQAEVAAKVTFI
ncbi:MAG TPA: FAD:protein FMN transferase, partial [Ktedonobacterales bacterium]|nr:FAD:protein FMN transferase [Ktedonobacterales bacterium]